MMLEAVKEALHEHLVQVKKTHESDLAKGFGEVYLPDGLERKYPAIPAKNWGWQYVFRQHRFPLIRVLEKSVATI